MKAKILQAVFATVLFVGLASVPGCDGDVALVNINGTWLLKIEYNFCDMPGFLKGGESRMESIPVTQSGDQLFSNFQDGDGNDVSMNGTLYGGRFMGWWTMRTPQQREIRFNSWGNVYLGGPEPVMDGWFVVDYDSDFHCYNEQFGFWAFVNPSSPPQGGGEPGEIIRQCPGVDIIFIMDTSGSMGDESQALCDGISGVRQRLIDLGLAPELIRVQLLGITGGPTFGGGFACLEDSTANRFGSTVPGNPPASGPNLNSSEDWGSATAVAAAGNSWNTGWVRIVVPISDEGPENGGGEFSCNADDTQSITNAIAVCVANNVIASPIIAGSPGRPPDPASCILAEGTRLAQGTNGLVTTSQDPGLDIGQNIFDLIVSGCATLPTGTR